MAAEAFEADARLSKGVVRRLQFVLRFADQAEHEVGLVAQARGMQPLDPLERRATRQLGGSGIACLEVQARQQQPAQGGFSRY